VNKIPEEIRQAIRDLHALEESLTRKQIAERLLVSINCVNETLAKPIPATLEERFWLHVDKSGGPNACWLWTASLTSNGYGQIRVPELNRPVVASRVSLFLQNGKWPSGDACHKCDNPPCVNPSHLFDGTRADNMQDCSRKGRVYTPSLRGTDNWKGKLTSDDVFHIKTLHHLCNRKDLATCFGVGVSHIGNIIKGRDRKYD
jgi:hypothetical protein